MHNSVKLLVIVLLTLLTAYAHVAAASPKDSQLQRLQGTWHVVGRMGEQEIRYAATATLKLAGQLLRFDLAETGTAGRTTLLLAPDTHRGEMLCFAIDAADQARGPFAAIVRPTSAGSWSIAMRPVDGSTELPPVAEYLLYRA